MTANRECELKLCVESREGYLDLREADRWGSRGTPVRQVNYYFDTEDLSLGSQRMMLRVRDAGRCILTLKCGREASPGNFDSAEFEVEIPRQRLEAALERPDSLLDPELSPVAELLARVGRLDLRLAGRLVNERVCREVDGWKLEVDRLTFPDGSESYELELETEDVDRARAWLEEELDARGIAHRPQRFTKFERLLEWYSRHGGPPHARAGDG